MVLTQLGHSAFQLDHRTLEIFRTGIAKVVGSGGGAVGGGLTLVGGLLTIMSAGAALPVLLVGTGIGLASGVTGGAAAITEKIIKVGGLGPYTVYSNHVRCMVR